MGNHDAADKSVNALKAKSTKILNFLYISLRQTRTTPEMQREDSCGIDGSIQSDCH